MTIKAGDKFNKRIRLGDGTNAPDGIVIILGFENRSVIYEIQGSCKYDGVYKQSKSQFMQVYFIRTFLPLIPIEEA
jgi:hypothetical protein